MRLIIVIKILFAIIAIWDNQSRLCAYLDIYDQHILLRNVQKGYRKYR